MAHRVSIPMFSLITSMMDSARKEAWLLRLAIKLSIHQFACVTAFGLATPSLSASSAARTECVTPSSLESSRRNQVRTRTMRAPSTCSTQIRTTLASLSFYASAQGITQVFLKTVSWSRSTLNLLPKCADALRSRC